MLGTAPNEGLVRNEAATPMPRPGTVRSGQTDRTVCAYGEVLPLLKQRLAGLSLWAGWVGLFRARRCVVDGWGHSPVPQAAVERLMAAHRLMEQLGVDRPWMMELDGALVAARRVGADHWVIATARPGLQVVFQTALRGVARRLDPLVEQLESV